MRLVFQKPHKSIKKISNIELNDFTVLTGVNGAGKSHLLEAIENGSIKIDGIDINKDNNQVRLFDWSNLIPNDEGKISSYQLTQERNNYWQNLSSRAAKYIPHLQKNLQNLGISDMSSRAIGELSLLDEQELKEKFQDPNLSQRIHKYFKNSGVGLSCRQARYV